MCCLKKEKKQNNKLCYKKYFNPSSSVSESHFLFDLLEEIHCSKTNLGQFWRALEKFSLVLMVLHSKHIVWSSLKHRILCLNPYEVTKNIFISASRTLSLGRLWQMSDYITSLNLMPDSPHKCDNKIQQYNRLPLT